MRIKMNNLFYLQILHDFVFQLSVSVAYCCLFFWVFLFFVLFFGGWGGVLLLLWLCFFFFFFFLNLLLTCPTHTNPSGSGLGTGGTFIKEHSYIFFTMRLAVRHSISFRPVARGGSGGSSDPPPPPPPNDQIQRDHKIIHP